MLRVDVIEPSRMDEPSNQSAAEPSAAYDEAVHWLMALQGATGRAEAGTRHAFEQWLAAAPEHSAAFQRCRADWEALEPLVSVYDPHAEAGAARSIRRSDLRWSWGWSLGMAATLAAVVAFGTLALHRYSPTFQTAAATQAAEHKTLTMTDGSRIDLNGRSKIRVHYYRVQRQAHLDEGEALFDVAKDSDRPFIVDAALGAVRVVGTSFHVTSEPDRLTVTVLRGQVRVEDRTLPARVVSLQAGQSVRVTAAGLDAIQAVATDNIGAWKRQMLIFDRASLRDVVAALQRQYGGTIRLDAAAAEIPLTAVIQFSDIDATLSALPRTLPVVVDHPLPNEWRIAAR